MNIGTAIRLQALANEMRAFIAESIERDERISAVTVFQWADRLSQEVVRARSVRPAETAPVDTSPGTTKQP